MDWLEPFVEEEDAIEDVEMEETVTPAPVETTPTPVAVQDVDENRPIAPSAPEPMTRKYR